jgi:hypothetical protein
MKRESFDNESKCECYATKCNQCGVRCEVYGNAEGYGKPNKEAVNRLIERIDIKEKGCQR